MALPVTWQPVTLSLSISNQKFISHSATTLDNIRRRTVGGGGVREEVEKKVYLLSFFQSVRSLGCEKEFLSALSRSCHGAWLTLSWFNLYQWRNVKKNKQTTTTTKKKYQTYTGSFANIHKPFWLFRQIFLSLARSLPVILGATVHRVWSKQHASVKLASPPINRRISLE